MDIREIIQSYDPNAPLEKASTIPSSWYVNPELANLEQQTVFSKSWQPAARAEQLRESGSYATCTIAGEPVVVVRGLTAFSALSSTSAGITPRKS